MKIINKETKETVATIIGGENMTLDEACELMGVRIMMNEEDYAQENGYDYESLDYVID